MPATLARILMRRPRNDVLGKDWIGRSSLPPTTLSMGDEVGIWSPREAVFPPPPDEGIAVVLKEALVTRLDARWEPGLAVAWEVAACQEDSPLVPGIGIHVDPHPPCMLCTPCNDGRHVDCRSSDRRRWSPGWIARHMSLPAWVVGRGVLELPAVPIRSRVFLHPLAKVRHALARTPARSPRRIAVLGADLAGVLAGLALERMHPDSVRCLVDPVSTRLDDADRWGYRCAAASEEEVPSRLGGAPDLVVLAECRPDGLRRAMSLCGNGGVVLLLDSPSDGDAECLDGIWRRGLSLVSGSGLSPDDLATAASWLPDLSGRLVDIPVGTRPFEEAASAQADLSVDPTLRAIVLTA